MGIWNWSCALSGGVMWIIKAYFKVVGFVAWVVFKWMGGWVWPGFHTNFFGFIMEIVHTTETHKGWHLCTWEHVNTRILLRFSKFLLALYEGGLNIHTIQPRPPIHCFHRCCYAISLKETLGRRHCSQTCYDVKISPKVFQEVFQLSLLSSSTFSNNKDLIPTFWSSSISSPFWCNCSMISQPPRNSPPT